VRIAARCALLALVAACAAEPQRDRLVIGATTTIEDSGLLERLLSAYDSLPDAPRVRAVTGGTGEVLELARRGDLDLALTHDPAAESLFVAQGHAASNRPLMRSDFLIAGPAADPAAVAGTDDAVAALAAVAEARAAWVTRGDESGTHRREMALWRDVARSGTARARAAADSVLAGTPPTWYVTAGLGMADALRFASEREAYILSESATFATLQPRPGLAALVRGGPRLANPYAVTVVAGSSREDAAARLADWLVSDSGRSRIAGFGDGRLFRAPDRAAAPAGAAAPSRAAD